MKPAWDKLMKKYDGHATILVGDVDCTADGKPLCEANGVEGFPTIKWGDPSALEDYEGGRTYDNLVDFAKANLKPLCSPKNIDLCEADKKAQIEKFMNMDAGTLEAEIEKAEAKFKEADETFQAELQKLNDKYAEIEKEKNEKQAEVKASGLSLMKAVKASKGDKEEL